MQRNTEQNQSPLPSRCRWDTETQKGWPWVAQPGSQDPRTPWKNPDNGVCQHLPRCLWPERTSVWTGPVQEPWLQAVRPVCSSLALGERAEGELCRFQAKQSQTLINRKQVPKHSGPPGVGVGKRHVPGCTASPSRRARRPACSCRPPGTPDASSKRMAATGWSGAIIAHQGAAGGGWARHRLGPPAGWAWRGGRR